MIVQAKSETLDSDAALRHVNIHDEIDNLSIIIQSIISYILYSTNATLEEADKPSIVLRIGRTRLKIMRRTGTTNGTVEFYGVCASNCSVSLAARSAFT